MKNSIYILILVLIVSCKNKDLEKTATIQNDSRVALLDSIYTELHNNNEFNGNVLIAEKGTVLFEKSFGMANVETKAKLNSNTVFELASVSKQFTAMAIVLLEKQGKLEYEDELSKYIPELQFYKDVTIEHLLYHTSGLPDYLQLLETYWDKQKIATNRDVINLFMLHQPNYDFEPNTDYEYSNTGYMLLATIIERASGMNYELFLKEYIFKPAKMNESLVYRRRYSPKNIENIAQGYLYSDSLKIKILPDELANEGLIYYADGIMGDGMVNSTTKDLLKWDRILYENTLINNLDKERIFNSYKFYDSIPTGYGYGWYIENDETYGKYVKHSGGWPGFVTHIERHLDNDKLIVVLQNVMLDRPKIPLKTTRKILYSIPLED